MTLPCHTASGDYIAVDQDIRFSQVANSFNIIVTITDDAIFENRESFFLRAELISAADVAGVSIDPDETTVTIDDLDGE